MGCGKSKPQAAKAPAAVIKEPTTPENNDAIETYPPTPEPQPQPAKQEEEVKEEPKPAPPLKLPSEVMKNNGSSGTACGHVMVDNVRTPVSYHLTSDATTPGAKMPLVPLVVIN